MFEKYKDKGLSGLLNIGNTCFINSCMQVLSHTYELNEILNNENYKNKLNDNYDSILLIEWDNLRKILWMKNCIIIPKKFISIIHKNAKIQNMEIFTNYSQNDLTEFLLFIINSFHNALSRSFNINISGKIINNTDKIALCCFKKIKDLFEKNYSEIMDLFYGIQISKLTLLESNLLLSITPDIFISLHLPIPNNKKDDNITIFNCLDLYIENEILDGDNCIFNEKLNKKVACKKQMLFWSLPKVLIIIIKRFDNNNNKNNILINFPFKLDLSKYIIGYNPNNYLYNLYAICNHIGSSLYGHYTSYIKNANNKWYNYDDANVNEISSSNIITSNAYCLFYRKYENDENNENS